MRKIRLAQRFHWHMRCSIMWPCEQSSLALFPWFSGRGRWRVVKQEVESTDIRTSGVYPVVDVSADESGNTRVQVKLKVGGPASNTVPGPDRPGPSDRDDGRRTRPLDSSGSVSYATSVPDECPGPRRHTPSCAAQPTPARQTHRQHAGAVQPDAGRDGAVPGGTGSLAVTWSPAGPANLDSSLVGPCVGVIAETIPDDGTASISGDQLHAQNATDACTVTLTLARVQSGQVNPAFTEGGDVKARQVRSASFTSTP